MQDLNFFSHVSGRVQPLIGKIFLKLLDCPSCRPHISVWTEVAGSVIFNSTRNEDPWHGLSRYLDEGIALVVLQSNVVLWLVSLDQDILKKECLNRRECEDIICALYLALQGLADWIIVSRTKMCKHPPPDAGGLSNVDWISFRILQNIDSSSLRELVEFIQWSGNRFLER